jgi:hypothetical protein
MELNLSSSSRNLQSHGEDALLNKHVQPTMTPCPPSEIETVSSMSLVAIPVEDGEAHIQTQWLPLVPAQILLWPQLPGASGLLVHWPILGILVPFVLKDHLILKPNEGRQWEGEESELSLTELPSVPDTGNTHCSQGPSNLLESIILH